MTRRELEYNVLHTFVQHNHNETLKMCRAITHDEFKKLDTEAFGKLVASYPDMLGEAVRADKSLGWLLEAIAERTAYDVTVRILGKWLRE